MQSVLFSHNSWKVFFGLFRFYFMCECFVFMYVPYACLMPAEVGRGHRIPWTLDLRMGCEPLCGPLQEHPVFFAAEPFLLPSTPSY